MPDDEKTAAESVADHAHAHVEGRRGAFSRLVLVRHGSTSWSRSGQHTGRTDLHLDALGRAAATGLAGRFVGDRLDLVLCSPLARAVETCTLAGFSEYPVLDADLMEWDYGLYEGRTTAEIRAERPGWELFADGCPGGEQASEVGERVDRVLDALDLDSTGTESAVIVAHGHLLRVLAARYLGLGPDLGRLFILHPATVSILGYEKEVRVLRSWNS